MSWRLRRSGLASAVTLLAACLIGSAVPGWARAADAGPLRVVATFSVLADMVREVGGAAVEVTSLVGPDADAHVFEPTPRDAQRVAKAHLIVANGLRYEGWIERLIAASGYRGKVVVASAGVTPRQAGRDGIDPHAWQNLVHAKRYVANIRAALAAAAPQHGAAIESRAADYLRRIDALDLETRIRIARVPAERRRVITAHDAFGYFAEAYGIEFIAPRGWTTGSEPSAEGVARIVRQLREQRASALLLENISDPRLLERIAREARVNVGGKLYSDALSAPGTEADTYLRMFAHNVDTLVAAIGTGARP